MTDVHLGAGQHRPKVGHRVGALALERTDCSVTADGVDLVRHQLTQDVGLDVARGEPDRALPHHGGLILEGRQNHRLAAGSLGQRFQRGQPLRMLFDRSHC